MRPPITARPDTRLRFRIAISIGAAAGALSGLFGVGGGILIVPALVVIGRLPQKQAHGTSLVAVAPIALFGLAGFVLDGKVDWPVAACLAIGSIVGATAGTRLLHVIPLRVLLLGFVAVLGVTAVELFLHDADSFGRDPLDVGGVLGLVGLGLVAGLLAGLLGIGGGVVLVPATILLFGIAPAAARGTALAVMVPTAVTGTVANVRNGIADLRAGALLGGAGAITAFVASRVSVGLDERLSNILFASLLIAVAARLLYGELRRPAGTASR